MTEPTNTTVPADKVAAISAGPRPDQNWFGLRQTPTVVQTLFFGALCLAACLGIWWYMTVGEGEERRISGTLIPSPAETFGKFPSLWFDGELSLNTVASLRRVVLGFGLAIVVGVPLGVLCGCFSWAEAFCAPLTLFGRNIPIAALIPLTFALFHIGEFQKIMFIFLACVAFIVTDTAGAIREISSSYVDTAYTLGASRLQVIFKVLFPLALPSIFNSLRLLFGLAFGYIMLAEVVQEGTGFGGLGAIINTAQRQGPRAYILLVIMIIPLVALAIDRVLYWIQKELFPHRYGGHGILRQAVRSVLRGWESVTSIFRRSPVALPGFPEPKAKGDAP